MLLPTLFAWHAGPAARTPVRETTMHVVPSLAVSSPHHVCLWPLRSSSRSFRPPFRVYPLVEDDMYSADKVRAVAQVSTRILSHVLHPSSRAECPSACKPPPLTTAVCSLFRASLPGTPCLQHFSLCNWWSPFACWPSAAYMAADCCAETPHWLLSRPLAAHALPAPPCGVSRHQDGHRSGGHCSAAPLRAARALRDG